MNWLDAPLLALDVESTGLNVDEDRIITIAIGRSAGPGDWTLIEDSLINPGVAIPVAAAKVHGIRDEHVAKGAEPAEVLESVHEILTQAAERRVPIVGHHVPFDATLIDRELRRHLGKPIPGDLLWLDTLVIFRRFDLTTGGRSLSALAEKHGIGFPAHDAARDALGALRLLHIMSSINDLLPLAPIEALQERQAEWHRAHLMAAEERRRSNGHRPREVETSWPLIPIGGRAA